jgi:hypothetical protein
MKTFLLMLGSAFMGVVLFVAAVYGYFYWQYYNAEPGKTVRFLGRDERMVTTVPPIADEKRFYGSHASTMGNFPDAARQSVLASGEGRIAGTALSDGKPAKGLRLRLALNGAAMSQWTTTDAEGRYEVAVPFGKYRVDGYELDSDTANEVLSGMTDGPRQPPFHRNIVMVAAEKPGYGLDLKFVVPVKKLGPFGEVKADEPIVASWEPYPGAVAYRLQITEWKERGDYSSQRHLFEWQNRPTVQGTEAELVNLKADFRKGHYYRVDIEALGEGDASLSNSADTFYISDFRIVDG